MHPITKRANKPGFIRLLLLWLPMIAIAFANATLRELLLVKYVDLLTLHQLSTLLLIIFCGIYIWLIFEHLKIQQSSAAFLTGFIWVLLTAAFEFILGRITGQSWEYLLESYNLANGKLWLLFLVFLFSFPYLCFKLRRKS